MESAASSSPAAQANSRRQISHISDPSPSKPPGSLLLALDHAPPIANGINLIDPREVLSDRFRNIFPYNLFNAVQSKCFDSIYRTNTNVVISAPTGSGKTAILELAICKLAHSRGTSSLKIVYLSPLKALCSERASDWRKKFTTLGMEVAELTGDTSKAEMARVRQASIIITTPEKWDSITRSWTDHRKLLDLVGLFLIDEVHLLKDSRGSTIEAVVSRMKIRGANVRFIALSATVPNSEDVAKWLGKNDTTNRHLPAHQEVFGEEYRPVKLQKFVYGFDSRTNDFQFDDFLNKQLFSHIAKHTQKKPILVFCQSRKSCEKAASKLAEEWSERQPQARPWFAPKDHQRVPVISPDLQDIVRYGVAFHHAGLDFQDRKAIEQAFLDGRINVICCTSTLAMGLNLPCHMVVLKDTKGYSEDKLEELSDLEVMQMLGRAGRPQFGNSAVAIILTRAGNKRHYEEMGSSQQILESTLHQNLIEHLNSEINLGTFQDIQNAKDWLEGTFLAVRLRRNPSYYKLADASSTTEDLDATLERICETNISKLRESGLITSEGRFCSTEYGRAMSKFVIRFTSMQKILDIPRGAKMEQLLTTLCEAEDFKDFRWKSYEREVFRDLNQDCFIAYPVKGTVNTTAHKVFLLVQIILGNVDVSNVREHIRRAIIAEARVVFETMHRLVRATIECKASESDGSTCRVALELERSMTARAWEGRTVQLTQVPQVGPVLMRKLVAAGITTVHALARTDSSDIERIASRNPPFGKKMLNELSSFPSLSLDVHITEKQPRGPSGTPIARVDSILGFSSATGKVMWHGKIPTVTFMAETTEGELVYWWRGTLRKFREDGCNRFSLHFEVELCDHREKIICHFACDEIVGTIVSRTLDHGLPASAFPPRAYRQTPAESRNLHGQKQATESWLDDEIDDDAMLEIIQKENAETNDQISASALLSDEDMWPLIDQDGNTQRKGRASQKKSTKEQGEQRQSPAVYQAEEEAPWEPVRLLNGRFKCNHRCADAGVKNGGRACTHRCCRDGVDQPRKPRRTSLKRKAEDDEDVAASAPKKNTKPKPPMKLVNASGLSTSEPNISHQNPDENASRSASLNNDCSIDLEGFDVDNEGLIDLTAVDSASKGNLTEGGISKAQCTSTKQQPVRDSDSILDSITDHDLQDRFTPNYTDGGRHDGKTFNTHAKLQKGQSNSTDGFSGDSVFDNLDEDMSDTQILDDEDSLKLSGSDQGKAPLFPVISWFSKEPLPALTGFDSPLGQEGYVNQETMETEDEALASMSSIFSGSFVDPSKHAAVDQEDIAPLPRSPHIDQTPKDINVMAIQKPQQDANADESPPSSHDGSKEPTQARLSWMTDADRETLKDYLDLIEIMD